MQLLHSEKKSFSVSFVLFLTCFLTDYFQGGKSSRIVNCVLALKSYSEWKQSGSNGIWKFGGNVKPITSAKQFVRKNSEPFTNSLSRTSSMNAKSSNGVVTENELNKMVSNHF